MTLCYCSAIRLVVEYSTKPSSILVEEDLEQIQK